MNRIFAGYLLICCIGLFTFCHKKKEIQTDTRDDFIGILPAQSEFTLLIDSGSFQIDKNCLFLDFNGSPCLSIDTLIIPLDGERKTVLSFPFSITPNQICCFMDGSIFFLQDSCLMKLKNKNIEYSIPFPYQQLNINKAGENGIYIFGLNPGSNKYDVYFIDNNKGGIIKIVSDTLAVHAVIGTGAISMAALDNTVYFLKKGEMRAIFQSGNPITSLVDCDAGIFYATTQNAGYFNDEGQAFVFYDKGVSKLMAYNDTLYLLDVAGRFSKITGTNYFRNLADSLQH